VELQIEWLKIQIAKDSGELIPAEVPPQIPLVVAPPTVATVEEMIPLRRTLGIERQGPGHGPFGA
jgi:hypothetical protein